MPTVLNNRDLYYFFLFSHLIRLFSLVAYIVRSKCSTAVYLRILVQIVCRVKYKKGKREINFYTIIFNFCYKHQGTEY